MKVVDRQTVNISTDLNIAGANSFYVPFTLRFWPDEVIVRSVSYANTNTDGSTNVCQVWTNIVDEGVIASFVSNSTYTSDVHSTFRILRKIQSGSFNFQVQLMPAAGNLAVQTAGALVPDTVKGQLQLILEFIKCN